MKKKKYIRLGIIISIFVLIFGIVYLLNDGNININKKEEEKLEIIPYEMENVNDYSYFFSVVNILNKYLGYLQEQNNDALYSILHSEYLKLYNINDNNMYSHLKTFNSNSQLSFKANFMTYKIYDNNYLYYVKGNIIENNFEDNNILANNVMFLVNIDYENITYAIYPLDSLYDVLPIKNPQKPIILNSYNELIGSNVITKEYICNLYLSDFIWQINNNLDNSYNLLSNDFQRRKFKKKNDYLNYMNDNKNKLSSQVFNCDSLSGEKHVYEIKDMNFNNYTFTEESIMNYKVEFTLN